MVDSPESGSGLPAASAKKNAMSSLPGPAWPFGTTAPLAVTTKLKASVPAAPTDTISGASPLGSEAGGMPVVSPTVCGGFGPVSETSVPPPSAPQLKSWFENSASLPMYSIRMLPGPVMPIVDGLPATPSRTIELVMKAKSLPTSGASMPPERVKKGAACAAVPRPSPAAIASAARLVAVLGFMCSSCWGCRARRDRGAHGSRLRFAIPVPMAQPIGFTRGSAPGAALRRAACQPRRPPGRQIAPRTSPRPAAPRRPAAAGRARLGAVR